MTNVLHRIAKRTLLAVCCGLITLPAIAHAAPSLSAPQGLSIAEIKMTGDEFLIIQNNTGSEITDLSSYWLTAYNNVNPLAAGVSSSQQQLPVAGLLSGQTLLLSSTAMQTCGASVAGKLSVSLGDSGGFLQITRSSLNANGSISQTAGDLVSWSSGTTGIIQSLPSNTKDPKAAYYRYLNGISYAWQQADVEPSNLCQLNVVVAGGQGSSSAVTPLTLAATSPPATILGTVTAGTDVVVAQLPAADIGLNAPQISELLPNPNGTGNDSTDEFIELYNPNPAAFDLTGFTLQTGTTTLHSYDFASGTMLPANSFKAFYASETKISLSNTAGQVNLLDPFGNVISGTGIYEKAKDGLSWAVANNIWYWTTVPTPNAANVIKQPVTKKVAAAAAKKSSKKGRAVKTVKTAKISNSTASASKFTEDDPGSTVHTWVLALVAGAALLYGAYEYRRDLANQLYRFTSKFGSGRAPRNVSKGRRSD